MKIDMRCNARGVGVGVGVRRANSVIRRGSSRRRAHTRCESQRLLQTRRGHRADAQPDVHLIDSQVDVVAARRATLASSPLAAAPAEGVTQVHELAAVAQPAGAALLVRWRTARAISPPPSQPAPTAAPPRRRRAGAAPGLTPRWLRRRHRRSLSRCLASRWTPSRWVRDNDPEAGWPATPQCRRAAPGTVAVAGLATVGSFGQRRCAFARPRFSEHRGWN